LKEAGSYTSLLGATLDIESLLSFFLAQKVSRGKTFHCESLEIVPQLNSKHIDYIAIVELLKLHLLAVCDWDKMVPFSRTDAMFSAQA
jgi:hypothetical protein